MAALMGERVDKLEVAVQAAKKTAGRVDKLEAAAKAAKETLGEMNGRMDAIWTTVDKHQTFLFDLHKLIGSTAERVDEVTKRVDVTQDAITALANLSYDNVIEVNTKVDDNRTANEQMIRRADENMVKNMEHLEAIVADASKRVEDVYAIKAVDILTKKTTRGAAPSAPPLPLNDYVVMGDPIRKKTGLLPRFFGKKKGPC